METHVKGFVLHSEGANEKHSHKLYITSWGGTPVHAHEIEGITSFDVGHQHAYAGYTAPAPSGVQHKAGDF